MNPSIVIQAANGRPSGLVLLFHGVGASPRDMVVAGRHAALVQPTAMVVSVAAPFASDLGQGLQWFSVLGVTEANRPVRIAEALPSFVEAVEQWQREAGVDQTRTTLIGFSQGAIMALAAAQLRKPPARRVIAIAGRSTRSAEAAGEAIDVHLLHGENDEIIPVRHSIEAALHFEKLGARVTLDTFDGVGHQLDARVVMRMAQRLIEPSGQTHEP